MPKLFKIGKYTVFFWSNELGEPIHIHIAEGNPSPNSTKVWLTQSGGFVVAHNKSRISQHELDQLLDLISTEFFYICRQWKTYFNVENIKFYC